MHGILQYECVIVVFAGAGFSLVQCASGRPDSWLPEF